MEKAWKKMAYETNKKEYSKKNAEYHKKTKINDLENRLRSAQKNYSEKVEKVTKNHVLDQETYDKLKEIEESIRTKYQQLQGPIKLLFGKLDSKDFYPKYILFLVQFLRKFEAQTSND